MLSRRYQLKGEYSGSGTEEIKMKKCKQKCVKKILSSAVMHRQTSNHSAKALGGMFE
jgi:hypothetical protein